MYVIHLGIICESNVGKKREGIVQIEV